MKSPAPELCSWLRWLSFACIFAVGHLSAAVRSSAAYTISAESLTGGAAQLASGSYTATVVVEPWVASVASPGYAVSNGFLGQLQAPPTVRLTARSGSAQAVMLNGTINPNGFETSAQFEYGLTTAYGNVAPVVLSPQNGVFAQAVSQTLGGLSPGTVYHYRLTASNVHGSVQTADAIFTTDTIPQEAWRQQYFQTTANTGEAADTADSDQDGVINLLEFAFGTDPKTSGLQAIRVVGNTIVPGMPKIIPPAGAEFPYLALFGRRKDYLLAGLSYVTQFSTDLKSWTSASTEPTVVADDGVMQAVTVPFPPPIDGVAVKFFRLAIIGP